MGRILLALFVAFASQAFAEDDTTTIVGSSTIAPLAEEVKRHLPVEKRPQLEIIATGSNKGIKSFCSAAVSTFAPLVMASRAMTPEEKTNCQSSLGTTVTSHQLGLNAIVFATYRRDDRAPLQLTAKDVFTALASRVPANDDCELRPNTAKTWRDISPNLPSDPIKIYGPGTTSGTRSVFLDLVMKPGAATYPCLAALKQSDGAAFKALVSDLRTDVWTDAEEDDVAMVAELHDHPETVGILGFSTASRFDRHLSLASVDGIAPSARSVADGTYSLVGELYLYTNEAALNENPLARAFLTAFLGADAIGPRGYLKKRGLVPLGTPASH